MIVDDLNVFGARRRPPEAHPELIVHANAVLAGPFPLERLEAIAGRNPQIAQPPGDLQLPELSPRDRFDAREAPDSMSIRERLGVGILE
jgi:hypothetical protein